jgi:hypothetical protein
MPYHIVFESEKEALDWLKSQQKTGGLFAIYRMNYTDFRIAEIELIPTN